MCKIFLNNCFIVFFSFCFVINFSCFAQSDIFYAIDKGSLKMVKSFLNEDMVNLKNIEVQFNSFAKNETLLNAACYKGNLDVVEAIVSYIYNKICKKFESSDKEYRDYVLSRHINLAGVDGQTPLHCACHPYNNLSCWQSLQVVEYLIENGAMNSVAMRNAAGRTPIDLAFNYRNYHVIKYLVKNGAKIDESYVRSVMRGASDAQEMQNNLKEIKSIQSNYDYMSIVREHDAKLKSKSEEGMNLLNRLSLPMGSSYFGIRSKSDSKVNKKNKDNCI